LSQYSIKDLEKLSGVKAHTIRIWEKRYGVLTPERTDTNIRFYSDLELKKLLNISLLIGFGHKISRVSQWSVDELHEQVQSVFGKREGLEEQAISNKINGLIISMIDLDERKFKQIYETSISKRGFEQTMLKVIYPFLERVGIMWGINEINPAEEHFITHLIRQKIIVEIDKLDVKPHPEPKRIVLFLPENEFHELGLLIANYLVRLHGHQAYYLGQHVPFDDMISVTRTVKPQYIITFVITSLQQEQIQKFMQDLCDQTLADVLISGRKELFDGFDLPACASYLASMDELIKIISA